MKRGDTLIVTEVSRLSRTLTDLMAIMGKCLEKGINLYTTKEGYSFDNSINSKVLCFAFGLVAEIERNLISMRTKEARPPESRGCRPWSEKGSYTKMNVLIENRKVIVGMLKRNCTIADICRRFDISRDTFMKFRSRYKEIDKAMKEKEIRRKGVAKTEGMILRWFNRWLNRSFSATKLQKHELSTKKSAKIAFQFFE